MGGVRGARLFGVSGGYLRLGPWPLWMEVHLPHRGPGAGHIHEPGAGRGQSQAPLASGTGSGAEGQRLVDGFAAECSSLGGRWTFHGLELGGARVGGSLLKRGVTHGAPRAGPSR